MGARISKLKEAIVAGDVASALALTEAALCEGESTQRILSQAMMPAMEQLGSDFSQGKAFLPELIAGGYAMSEAVDLFAEDLPFSTSFDNRRVIVLGTAEGDLHDIGKNIVKITLHGVGFDVVDLGVDVKTERFVRAAEQSGAQLVGISALLSTTLSAVAETVRELHLRLPVKVVVGGAPVTEGFAKSIAADGFAPDAYLAAKMAQDLVSTSVPGARPRLESGGGRA